MLCTATHSHEEERRVAPALQRSVLHVFVFHAKKSPQRPAHATARVSATNAATLSRQAKRASHDPSLFGSNLMGDARRACNKQATHTATAIHSRHARDANADGRGDRGAAGATVAKARTRTHIIYAHARARARARTQHAHTHASAHVHTCARAHGDTHAHLNNAEQGSYVLEEHQRRPVIVRSTGAATDGERASMPVGRSQ